MEPIDFKKLEETPFMRYARKVFSILFLALWTLSGFAQENPGKQPADPSAPQYTFLRDVVYGHKDGMALTFDVVRPNLNANGAGVLYMVSGGWYSLWVQPERIVWWYKPVLDKGFTVFLVRHGSAPRYKVPDAVEDVRRCVRFIRMTAADYGVDPERLGVTGMSAGGHLSLMLGVAADNGDPKAEDAVLRQSDRVACVVADFPPTDLRPWVRKKGTTASRDFPALQFEEEKAPACSPLLLVNKEAPPTLLIHGDKDKLVPIEHSRRILEAFKTAGVPSDLIVIEGGQHGFIGAAKRRADDATVAWFEKYLVPRKQAVASRVP